MDAIRQNRIYQSNARVAWANFNEDPDTITICRFDYRWHINRIQKPSKYGFRAHLFGWLVTLAPSPTVNRDALRWSNRKSMQVSVGNLNRPSDLAMRDGHSREQCHGLANRRGQFLNISSFAANNSFIWRIRDQEVSAKSRAKRSGNIVDLRGD
jgi:hypothetical protein